MPEEVDYTEHQLTDTVASPCIHKRVEINAAVGISFKLCAGTDARIQDIHDRGQYGEIEDAYAVASRRQRKGIPVDTTHRMPLVGLPPADFHGDRMDSRRIGDAFRPNIR